MPWVAARQAPLGGLALLAGAALVGAAVPLMAYRTAVWVPLAVLVAGVLATAVVMRPMLALHASIALVPLELVSFIKLGAGGISPSEGMFALTGLGWVMNRVAARNPVFVAAPLSWPLAGLVLAIVPGIAIATHTYPVVRMLFMWTACFVVYQMVVTDGRVETVRSLLMVLALSAGVVGVIAAVQSGGGSLVQLSGAGDIASGRAEGTFGHPNTLATFEGLALPGALVLGLAGPRSWRPFALVAALLAAAGVAASLSRGGLLAMVGAIAVLTLWPPVRRLALVLAVIVAGFAATGATAFGDLQQVQVLSERLSSISYSAAGVDPRFIVWHGTPQIILDHPVFGVGGNSFEYVAPNYGLLFGAAAEDTFDHAHNIALTIAAELGLVGLAALLATTWMLARLLVVSYMRAGPVERGLVLAIAAAFASLILQGMVDYTLRSNVVVAVIFMLCGAAVVLWRDTGPGGAAQPSSSR